MPIDLAIFDDIEAAARDAGGLLDRARQPSLHDRIDWFRLMRDHCPPRGRPLVIRARSANSRAWLFLAIEGRTACAYANWYTLDFRLIDNGTPDPDLAEAIADHLRTRLHCDLVDLAPLSLKSAACLESAFRRAGWLTCKSETSTNWSVMPCSWDEYWQARPSQLRNTVARKARAIETRIFDAFNLGAWATYEAIYAQSWKPAEGAPAFLRALAEQEGNAGTLRLGLGLLDGSPVAAQLWLVENGVATIHKLAHLESARRHSPGSVLSAALFRHVIEVDKVREIDFGTGNDSYKADWMDQARPLFRLRLWNSGSAAGWAGAARDRVSALARRLRAS